MFCADFIATFENVYLNSETVSSLPADRHSIFEYLFCGIFYRARPKVQRISCAESVGKRSHQQPVQKIEEKETREEN